MPNATEADDHERADLWSLREDSLVETRPDGTLLVYTRWGDVTIDDPDPAVADWLYRMTLGPMSLRNALPETMPPGQDAPATAARLRKVLDALGGAVVRTLGVTDLGGPLLSLVPIAPRAKFTAPVLDRLRPVRLSRFAALRMRGDEVVLESPLALHRVVFHRSVAARLIVSIGPAATVRDLATATALPEPLVADVLGYVAAAGMVALGDVSAESGLAEFAEDRDPRLAAWSQEDLLFHTRSRTGRHDEPIGAVPDDEPPAFAEPVVEGPRFGLYSPDLGKILTGDPPFAAVLEDRRAFTTFDERRLTAHALGELLFRAARVRSPSSHSPLHELELYVTLDRCAGLPRGIYRYDPPSHSLTLINAVAGQITELLDDAAVTAGTADRPPALLTLTTRLGRLSWAYRGIPYATALRHVGMVQQTFSLVATAMGLAPLVLAFGDIELANRVFRLDWPAEVAVGEFVLGVHPGIDQLTGS